MPSAQTNFYFSSLRQILSGYYEFMLSNKMYSQLAKTTSCGMTLLLFIGFFLFLILLII